MLDRLTAQVTRSLIDERLRLQEMQRRKVVVQDAEIAEAIIGIERRNNMPPGTLKRQLAGAGLNLRSMIDQYRVQIGWTRVLHDTLGGGVTRSLSLDIHGKSLSSSLLEMEVPDTQKAAR